MGRPLRKDVNGTDVRFDYQTTSAGIKVAFYDGSTLQTDGIVIKQRGAKTFMIARRGTPLTRFTAVLVTGTPSALGQMRIVGFTNQGQSADNGAVAIAKITKRVATDFSGNKYTWYLENDSSEDYIVLTPVAG